VPNDTPAYELKKKKKAYEWRIRNAESGVRAWATVTWVGIPVKACMSVCVVLYRYWPCGRADPQSKESYLPSVTVCNIRSSRLLPMGNGPESLTRKTGHTVTAFEFFVSQNHLKMATNRGRNM
jgi:hypothetical protein